MAIREAKAARASDVGVGEVVAGEDAVPRALRTSRIPQGPPQGRGGPNDRGVYESVGEDEVADDFEDEEPDHSEEPGPAPSPVGEVPAEEDIELDEDSIGNRKETVDAPATESDKPRRRRRRGGRGRRGRPSDAKEPVGKAPADDEAADEVEEPVEEETVVEEVEAPTDQPAEDAEAEETPKPKRRRGRRGGRGRGKKATGTASEAAPKRSAKEAKEVAKTGSTDAHIVDDEPVDVEPPAEPQSYRDLDTIIDDYDE